MNDTTLRLSRPWLISVAVLAPLLVCAALSAFRGSVTVATSALLLVLVVVGVAATGDRLGGFTAAVSSGLWFDFFLTEPYLRFTIRDTDDVEVTVLLVLIGAGVTELALWGRRQQGKASVRAGYLDGVLQAAEVVALHNDPPQALAGQVAQQIAQVVEIERCRFVAGPVRDPRYAVLDANGTVVRNGHPVDVERHGLPTDEETVLLVRRGGETVGHFILTSAARVAYPSREQRRVAVLLADQMAAVLDGPAAH
jgi:K+-sensing histidine kinase KdpD